MAEITLKPFHGRVRVTALGEVIADTNGCAGAAGARL